MRYEEVNFLDYGGIIFTSANSIKFLEAKKIDKKKLEKSKSSDKKTETSKEATT